ncbi:SIMPL domain-containing protein [Pseudophaeobacter sp.]|uniref:SIMPL domain-containing protein n=1 Tax=Pseudophaeobacter sp. TaxID=1971739 RepID=UPI0022031D23|nr:SIMPL domain-containing protein [Phaeobacter sp. G2]
MKTKTVLVTALAMALTLGTALKADTGTDRQILVSGEGRVEVAPDLAVITLGVSKEAKEAGEAMALVSEDMFAVVQELRAVGIADKDLQTQQISLQPVWSNGGSYNSSGERRITGFLAANTVNLRVRDLDQLGEVLDRVLRAGANQFQGLRFDVADHALLQDQMRASAVADARHKAEQLAAAAGVTLGPVRTITDQDHGGGRPMMAMEMSRSGAMPIEAGELSFSHNVQVVFDLVVPTE